MILRGVFLFNKADVEWYYQPNAHSKNTRSFFPDAWDVFEKTIPTSERDNFLEAYRRRLSGELGVAGKWL